MHSHRSQMQLPEKIGTIPPADPLKFVAICILGPPSTSKASEKLAVIKTNRYTKLTRAIPTTTIASSQVPNIFSNDWVIHYGISDIVLSDSGEQFFRQFFTSL